MSVSVCHCQCQSKIYSVARIAELLRSPRGHSRVTKLYWGRIVKTGMFLNGRRAETGMIGCQMAASSRGAMQQLEMCVDRQLWAGMTARLIMMMWWWRAKLATTRQVGYTNKLVQVWWRETTKRHDSHSEVTRCGRRSQCRVIRAPETWS